MMRLGIPHFMRFMLLIFLSRKQSWLLLTLNFVFLCTFISGRSNIVTGVAKNIKEHFKKYPLAIVNVKGRAKGTSVREVVFKLEVCLLAILVARLIWHHPHIH